MKEGAARFPGRGFERLARRSGCEQRVIGGYEKKEKLS
jgi:hypothetical protein